MAIVITDPSLLSQFTSAAYSVEILDAQGNLLGTFAPPRGKVPFSVNSPYSDEEIERRRKQPDGRPLAEIIRELENRG